MTVNTGKNDLTRLRGAARQASRLLKALAHSDRLLLLCELSQGERCVGEFGRRLGIGQPTLSQQLGVLRRAGLVDTRREGKRIHYRLASGAALGVIGALYDQYCGGGGKKAKR